MSLRDDLQIGKTAVFKDHSEVQVYFQKFKKYARIDKENYHKYLNPNSICSTCPPKLDSDTSSRLKYCERPIRSYIEFISHLGYSERLFGERICFAMDEKLPSRSIYSKFRMYGDLHKYMKTDDDFFLFTPDCKKFTKTNKAMIAAAYPHREVSCDYCPCQTIVYTPFKFIRHLQALEKKFSCFFIFDIDGLKYNDQRNMDRIKRFLLSRNLSNVIRNVIPDDNQEKQLVSFDDENDDEAQIKKQDQSYKNKSKKENKIADISTQSIHQNDLDESLVIDHTKLELIKRNEDFELKEKDLTFKSLLSLTRDDLSYLLEKYNLEEGYEIEKAELVLNLHFKKDSKKTENVFKSPEKLAIKSSSHNLIQKSSEKLAIQSSPQNLRQKSSEKLAIQSSPHNLRQKSSEKLAIQSSSQNLVSNSPEKLAIQSSSHNLAQKSPDKLAIKSSSQNLAQKSPDKLAINSSSQNLVTESPERLAIQSSSHNLRQKSPEKLAIKSSSSDNLVQKSPEKLAIKSSSSDNLALKSFNNLTSESLKQKILKNKLDLEQLKVGSDFVFQNKKIKLREIVYSEGQEDQECNDSNQTMNSTCSYSSRRDSYNNDHSYTSNKNCSRKRKANEIDTDDNSSSHNVYDNLLKSDEYCSKSRQDSNNNQCEHLSKDSSFCQSAEANELANDQNDEEAQSTIPDDNFDLNRPPLYNSSIKIKKENRTEEDDENANRMVE